MLLCPRCFQFLRQLRFAVSKDRSRIVFFILLLTCVQVTSHASLWAESPTAEKTEWHGKVVDESGLPIEGIVVEVVDSHGRSLLEARSDQEGKFSFASAVAAAWQRLYQPGAVARAL